jgi:hypothetical protein
MKTKYGSRTATAVIISDPWGHRWPIEANGDLLATPPRPWPSAATATTRNGPHHRACNVPGHVGDRILGTHRMRYSRVCRSCG